MNAKILLLMISIIMVCTTGCIEDDELVECTIINITLIDGGDGDFKHEFNIIYLNSDGHVKQMATSISDTYTSFEIKLSNDGTYKLYYLRTTLGMSFWELHVPETVIFY